jgi:glycine/sarcosine/betaine reductase complex component A
MDPATQKQIKNIADNIGEGKIEDILVLLGAGDIEGALISAETVTIGDPSFSGPLAGVSLGLPVYHILEPMMREAIPKDVYDEEVGIVAMTEDVDAIGKEFEKVRNQSS